MDLSGDGARHQLSGHAVIAAEAGVRTIVCMRLPNGS